MSTSVCGRCHRAVPGGPGRLLPPGSHRSGHARSTHPARQIRGLPGERAVVRAGGSGYCRLSSVKRSHGIRALSDRTGSLSCHTATRNARRLRRARKRETILETGGGHKKCRTPSLTSSAGQLHSLACRLPCWNETRSRKKQRQMAEKSPAELVKAIREAMGLTQEQFAAQFGVTVATVNRWENGSATPQPLAMKNLRELVEQHGLG